MRYDTVIFDLDGTLTDTLDDLADSVNYALSKMNYPLRSKDEVRMFVGNGVKKLIERSAPEGTSDKETDNLLKIFREYYNDHSMVKTKPYDGICELLMRFKDKGVKTAVVTNKTQETAFIIVENMFDGLIDTAIGQHEGFARKPDPEGVNLVINKLGSTKEKCIYVGDSDVDCKTGHNAGIPVIGVSWGFRGRAVLEENGADYVVDSPDEILDIIFEDGEY